jgi:EAL domain-containing protein (putative c-di-GMP-specific phosphodiesterase class I)
MTTSTALLERLLLREGVSVLYQPIVELGRQSSRLHGVECLTRGPAGTHAESPTILFEYVRRCGEEPAIDRACLLSALEGSRDLSGEPRLSMNVHASTLSRDAHFADFLAGAAETAGVDATRITVEIVENAPPHDGPAFRRALQDLRSHGMLIALDDVGLGHSNYKMIVDVRPDYFKIDRFFVSAVHDDSYRLAVLESVARLADRVGARVVAEGVETEAELAAVRDLGIELIQGFFFAPPLSAASASLHPLFQHQPRNQRTHGEPGHDQEA